MTKGSKLERNVELVVKSVSRIEGVVESLLVRTMKLEKNVDSLTEGMEFVIGKMVTKAEFSDVVYREINPRLDKVEAGLGKVETRFVKFEENEIDKRNQLDVRVSRLEKTR